MKRTFWLICAATGLFATGCSEPIERSEPTPVTEYVEVPDQYFFEWLVRWFDTDKDGRISTEEAAKVTSPLFLT